MRHFLFLFALCAGTVSPAAEKNLPEGRSVLSDKPLAAFRLGGAKGKAESSFVDVKGQPFRRALRVVVKSRTDQDYQLQLSQASAAPVRKGDAMLARVTLRCTQSSAETGEGSVRVVFERRGAPWTKSLSRRVAPGRKWKTFALRFRAAENLAAGAAQFSITLGTLAQTIEIGAVSMVNYEHQIRYQDLPPLPLTYAGREPDAPWRRAARARIDKHRKADITIRVTGPTGLPVRQADVRVRLVRHKYAFGSAISVPFLKRQGKKRDIERYWKEVRRLFNRVTLENGLKWKLWEIWPRADTLEVVRWMRANDIEVRGHVLVWPSWKHTPRGLDRLANDPAALRARVLRHIGDVAGATRGRLVEWDVINEPYTNNDIMKVLGDEEMVRWFQAARAKTKFTKLFINDYGILSAGGLDASHQAHYEKTIRFLIDRGAPLDGIGMQGHFGDTLTPPARVLEILNRFAKFGKTIEVTEFDINNDDEQAQADYTRDFMTAVFSHPATNGIIMWGFWDGRHGKRSAPIFREDWSLKPSGRVWIDLVHKTWSTDVRCKTDERGTAKVRGFQGKYELTVRKRNLEVTFPLTVGPAGRTRHVILTGANVP